MAGGYSLKAIKRRRQLWLYALFLTICLYLWLSVHSSLADKPKHSEAYYEDRYPLAWEHVYLSSGQGGAWYIPPHWGTPSDPLPNTILEAALLAHRLANASSHTIPYSDIPLIVHQTWKDTIITTWPEDIAQGLEKWLQYAAVPGDASMAYFLWLDDGCEWLIEEAEPGLVESVNALPQMVEKMDVFRIIVCNTIGGIYSDIDTLPLRSPAAWLSESDISPWSDIKTGAKYSTATGTTATVEQPARLLLGIEGDNEPDTDTHWRMGYNFPVQLTQWTLASSPKHPVLYRFLSTFAERIKDLAKPYKGDITAAAKAGAYKKEDPLKLTGPEAITAATMGWLNDTTGLRWDALTGLTDGGRSKAVGDTIIFPITAFNPGRSKYGNMGSKPITHPDARILHNAQGSWKHFDVKVELGKLCRTAFGFCKDWSKVPQ